jgi:arginase family enzyme
MNLSIYFEPLREEHDGIYADHRTLGGNTERFVTKFPDWREADLAFFGINEIRGSNLPPSAGFSAHAIRKKLFAMKRRTGRSRIVDLGTLRPGITLEDTYLRIKEIVEMLISHNTIPILIGGSHDLDYGQFLAYENLDQPVNLVMIDSRMDMSEDPEVVQNRQHLHRILMHEPNFLFSFSQIAYQTYLVEHEVITTLEKLYFDTYRVGEVHKDIEAIEPAVRHANLLSFDISAIRTQDAPGYEPANPFGLTGEEACQLCWYAGANDHLSSIGIYEYNPDLDGRHLTAMTIATMIWYFIEGYYHRKNEVDFQSKNFTKYAVGFHDNPHKMVFYKSRNSDKWWMEVEKLYGRRQVSVVPCSYEDYLLAAKGEVPQRWILTQARM